MQHQLVTGHTVYAAYLIHQKQLSPDCTNRKDTEKNIQR